MTGRIIGTGSYVPERIVTNEELAEVVETSDEWIVTRTGIHERRIAETEGTSVLAARAAERALKQRKLILFCLRHPHRITVSRTEPVKCRRPSARFVLWRLISVRHVPDLKSRSVPPRHLSRPVYIGRDSSSVPTV